MKTNQLFAIASQFDFEGTSSDIQPVGEGLINDTFLVKTNRGQPGFILQRKNKKVFTDVPAMMDNIDKVTRHLHHKIRSTPDLQLRETLTLVPVQGRFYTLDENGDFWAACRFIDRTYTHHKASTPELAREGGTAIGQFQWLLSDFNLPLTEILPGFHDIRHRFTQWDDVLARDPVGRIKEVGREIEWIESRREEMLCFRKKVETGVIPRRITHNDTKISNILFDANGKAVCVIDLDTVQYGTVLNDFGDAVRSYANAGAEDDPHPENIFLKKPIYEAFTRGYLSQAIRFLTSEELDDLAFSARYITFEQVLRFLMDYIEGDRYYKTAYPGHNLVRTRAQYRLLESMEQHYQWMCEIVRKNSSV